jgi:hypothetical protein
LRLIFDMFDTIDYLQFHKRDRKIKNWDKEYKNIHLPQFPCNEHVIKISHLNEWTLQCNNKSFT